jgi:hypothetical protein
MYNIKEKGKFILLLCALLLIEIFSTNSQTQNVQQLDSTINEMYSDRLIAQDLIFKMAENIHQQKTILFAKYDQDSINRALNHHFEKIAGFINSYDKTALTNDEANLLSSFKTKISRLSSITLNANEDQSVLYKKDKYNVQLDLLLLDLNRLAEIQVSRSGHLKDDSHKIVSFSNIINELNKALMIITALGIAAMALTSKSIVPRFPQQERLN